MRLDKFLKVSRIIKRRTVAKDTSNAGIINVNDRKAKASTDVVEGDIIEIVYPNSKIKVKVISTRLAVKKEDAISMYEVIEN